MTSDVCEAVTSLLAFVQENDHCDLPRSGDEFHRLQDLDAEVYSACSEAGIQLREIPAKRNLRPFELTHIPSYHTSDGFTVVATENWLQSMRGILARAARTEPAGVLAAAAMNAAPVSPTGFEGGAALADALGIRPERRGAFFQ